MKAHARALTATKQGPCSRWDRSAFRLHALAMNPDLAVMASLASVESHQDAQPVHWMQRDRVLASIIKSAVAQENAIARQRGAELGNDALISADILVRLGMAGATEPRGIVACSYFALRLLWRSCALTIRRHGAMERAAHARRPGRRSA